MRIRDSLVSRTRGHGSAAGLFDAGMIGTADGKDDLTAFRAGFIKHLHSDLATLLVQGFIAGGLGSASAPFRIYGPRDRGRLPNVIAPSRPEPAPFNPQEPTPGTSSMVRQLLGAFATDINDRMFDATSPQIDTVIQGIDIKLPTGVSPNLVGPPQAMRPFVVSGDTTLTPHLLELADGCDVLLQEVIDYDTSVASINALPVPEPVKEAFRNHMFGSHTTEAQLAELLRDIQVGSLVLHHLVPGDIARGGWARVAERLGQGARREVIAGADGLVAGVR